MEGETSGNARIRSDRNGVSANVSNIEQENSNDDEFDAMLDGYDSTGERSPGSSGSGGEEEMDVTSEYQSQSRPLTFNSTADHIPISRHGMAICEHCGSIGIRDAFYSKTKQYCSMACSRAVQSSNSSSQSTGDKKGSSTVPPIKLIKNSKPSISKTLPPDEELIDVQNGSSADLSPKPDCSTSFKWENYLPKKEFYAAPVSCFPHVALTDCWDNMVVGMKLEIENKDIDNTIVFEKAYWIAMVVRIAGYKALLRYEGYGQDSSKDFWVNLCVEPVYPVGWCASSRKPLIPPKSIQHKCEDWKEFLVKRLTGSRTLPAGFHIDVKKAINDSRFHAGMLLEVIDKNRISVVRVATLDQVIGGRIHVRYQGSENTDEGFWCHEKSPLIHPIGWAAVVGHSLRASTEYAKTSLQKVLLRKYDENDATWEMFPKIPSIEGENTFKAGMKLETIDPLNLSTICVATVMKVLRHGYIMIGIDGMMEESGADWFCYHSSSPTIFPAGFSALNKIEITPPKGYVGTFNWFDYLRKTKSLAAPVNLFKQEVNTCNFKVGMKIEAVDLMEPRLICVGTVVNVIGRLLRIHFDGWDSHYDQWCDCESVDLYPAGWCESVCYPLEPPRTNSGPMSSRRKKPKGMTYRGPRRRKRNSAGNIRTPQLLTVRRMNVSDASAQNSPSVPDRSTNLSLSNPVQVKIESEEDIQMDSAFTFFSTN
ncbi:MBT domain-containing protein 1 [Nymphon striatum]|nr:MBT domain-containing protein 1 [Nymphon striatum]